MTASTSPLTILGRCHRRSGDIPFGLLLPDRLLHLYVIGQTGTGKSTLLLNLAYQDARNGNGFALIDPHGDLAASLAEMPDCDALVWNVGDPASPFGYNPLTRAGSLLRPLVASGLLEALRKQWSDAWGVRMEHLLRHALLALLSAPKADLRDILRLFLDKTFRGQVLDHVDDAQVRQFWLHEYPLMHSRSTGDGLGPIANKLGAFLSHPLIRRALCEPGEPLRFRTIMDSRKILVVNLSKGRIGSDIANVLGGLLVAAIANAAFSRHDVSEQDRAPFFLYIDEFHSFTTESLGDVLSETRKYNLGAILSQQHLKQSSEQVFASIMGNVGTVICFRVGASDASVLAAQINYAPSCELTTLPNYRAFIRMMIEGQPSKPFTATTVYPPGTSEPSSNIRVNQV